MTFLKSKIVNHKSPQRGFIALTSTIIIAAVLLILSVSVASSGFQGRFSVFDGEVKEVSRGLAEGCVETAMLKYAQQGDAYVTGAFPETETIGTHTCEVVSVTDTGSEIRVRARAVFQSAVTNLEVEFSDTSPYDVASWEEVPN